MNVYENLIVTQMMKEGDKYYENIFASKNN